MSLQPGQSLSHYRIAEKIGEGGMGQVYRAADDNLDRPVAIKVLPADFASDPERLARFEREAKLLASLNHPHVAAVHGFEESGGIRFLVLEMVAGEDLSRRLARGPLPVEEAVEIARQIAAAMEEAHDKGIVHRDLKPGNIKITPEGKAKVLDFGLAKAWAGDAGPASGPPVDLSHSPTMAYSATRAGIILGTAPYMAPEQARGHSVDKRADIWAFGVVLFEMLTGKQLFRGETVSDVLAAVLKTEPDWTSLPADVPAPVIALLRHCLARSPRERLRDIGDARLFLDGDLAAHPAGERPSPAPSRLLRPASLLPGVLAGGDPEPLARVTGTWVTVRSFSRDGRYLALSLYHPETGSDIWYLDLQEGGEARPYLVSAANEYGPVLSPDHEWLAYFSNEGDSSGTYLRRFPGGGDKVSVTTEDCTNVRWTPDSREILLECETDNGTQVLAASVEPGPPLRLGKPTLLFEGSYATSSDAGSSFSLSADGTRLLLARRGSEFRRSRQLVVVQDWLADVVRLTRR